MSCSRDGPPTAVSGRGIYRLVNSPVHDAHHLQGHEDVFEGEEHEHAVAGGVQHVAQHCEAQGVLAHQRPHQRDEAHVAEAAQAARVVVALQL